MSFFRQIIRQQCDLAPPDAMFARVEWTACPCFQETLQLQALILQTDLFVEKNK
jgi:hypothetical protein